MRGLLLPNLPGKLHRLPHCKEQTRFAPYDLTILVLDILHGALTEPQHPESWLKPLIMCQSTYA